MHFSLAVLSKKAIDAALQAKWDQAADINLQILEQNPSNIEAKIRLGRAYIQTRKFDKARKMFREVLHVDPINSVALKNLELAKMEKSETKGQIQIDTKSLLKEPGTTTEASLFISAKGVTSKDFVSGENLLLFIKKRSIDVYKIKKDEKFFIGSISNESVVQKVNVAHQKCARICAGYLKGHDKEITILIKCSVPVFKADKQDIRPYLKKGSIDEPELEMEEEASAEIE